MGDKRNQALFSVIFKDGSHFIGGSSYKETKWLEIPNKKIKRIFYRLPDGNHLCLGNYNKYYHMIEATTDLTGERRGKTNIEYAYIMGERNGIVTSYRITLINRKNTRYKLGDILRRNFKENDEKILKLNPNGWK